MAVTQKNTDGVKYASLNDISAANVDNSEDVSNTGGGCGPYKATVLQRLSHPVVFTGHAGLLLAIHLCAITYFNGILTTLERQFQLSTSEVGTLTVINDASVLCVILLVTHFGQKSHRPRWIAGGALVIAMALFVCSLPHWLSNPLDPESLIAGGIVRGRSHQMSIHCDNRTGDRNSSTPSECKTEFIHGGMGMVKWIVIGQIIWGCGAAPLFPLTFSYIDDAVKRHTFTSYTAFMFIAMIIGPMVGFFTTSIATALYVDFDRLPSELIPDLHQHDPRWIGAWWLAFPFFSVCLILIAVPMFFYPKVMRQKLAEEKNDKGEDKDGDNINNLPMTKGSIFRDSSGGIISMIKDLLQTIKRLLSNGPLMLMCFGAAAETGIAAAATAFNVKYLQTQFRMSPATAAMVMGGVMVPCVLIAQVVSAVICRCFKLSNSKQCAAFILISHSICFAFMISMLFIGCETTAIAGINTSYPSGDDFSTTSPDLTTSRVRVVETTLELVNTCNIDCRCAEDIFLPVCGVNNISYISPCHAGCSQFNSNNTFKEYFQCACISSNDGHMGKNAVPGLCKGSCDTKQQLVIFIGVAICATFSMALTFNPTVFVTFRLVEANDRAIALGIKSLITKCFGLFPAPILFGLAINFTCILWQYTCGDRGSCWYYDVVSYRYLFQGMQLLLKFLSVICFMLLYVVIKSDIKETKEAEQNELSEIKKTPASLT